MINSIGFYKLDEDIYSNNITEMMNCYLIDQYRNLKKKCYLKYIETKDNIVIFHIMNGNDIVYGEVTVLADTRIINDVKLVDGYFEDKPDL